jgi:hypothetical protein
MRKWLLICIVISLAACKQKKLDLSGSVPVKLKDFMSAFTPITQTFYATDTNITKIADSISIGYSVLTQFIPDTVINKFVKKDKEYSIQPVGIIDKEKAKEKYLLLTFTRNKKTRLVTFVLNDKNKFLAAKELLSDKNNDDYLHTISINKEPTFITGKEKMSENRILKYSHVGWIYSSPNTFIVIMNDGNEDTKKNAVIINPIDSLSKKNKLSGNYIQNSKNFIAIRDGKNVNEYLFFIHFEKDNGDCTGELKGKMKMKDASTAQYSEGGDPCVIDFTFNGNEIIVKEKGSCGNRRGMDCFFDDTYVKKKESIKKKK